MSDTIHVQLEQAQSLVKIVFVDFSSGFNTIQPHPMVDKLVDLGVNPKLCFVD